MMLAFLRGSGGRTGPPLCAALNGRDVLGGLGFADLAVFELVLQVARMLFLSILPTFVVARKRIMSDVAGDA